jgi:hypothetical protein
MKTIRPDLSEILHFELELHPSMKPVDLRKLLFQASYGADHMLEWAVRDPGLFRASFTREWEHASRIAPGILPVIQIVGPSGSVARIHLSAAAAAGLSPEPLLEKILQQPLLHSCGTTASDLLRSAAGLGFPALLPWTPEEILAGGIPQTPPSHSADYGETHYRLVNDWKALRLHLPGSAATLVLPG